MTGLELIQQIIDDMSDAIEEGRSVEGYETEAEMQAYIDGMEYATSVLKERYSISDKGRDPEPDLGLFDFEEER